MLTFQAASPRRGYAIGPAFKFYDSDSIIAARNLSLPSIVIASYIHKRMLDMLDLSRVFGFVTDHGSILDPMFDALCDVPRPSVVGARGIFEQVRNGTTVVLDAGGIAIVDPTPDVLARYEKLRGKRPPREDPVAGEIVRRMVIGIRHAKELRKQPLPFDLPSQGRILEIGRRLAAGELPSKDDEAYVKSLLERDDVP